MTDRADLERYRVRLRRLTYGIFPLTRLWTKWVYSGEWTEYRGMGLRRKFKNWPITLTIAVEKQRFEVEGMAEGGRWEPLSSWRLDELRQAEDFAAALRRQAGGGAPLQLGEPGRPAGVGVGSLVRHIRDIEAIRSYDEVLAILRQSGIQQVTDWLTHWGDEGRKRIVQLYSENAKTHATSCAYCQGQPMPSDLRAAVDRCKSPVE